MSTIAGTVRIEKVGLKGMSLLLMYTPWLMVVSAYLMKPYMISKIYTYIYIYTLHVYIYNNDIMCAISG